MALPPEVASLASDMARWRRDLHAHPETAFEEWRTSGFVAERLKRWGLEVHTGLGRTGVVGVLRSGASERSIALRADMDALPISEETALPHASTRDGVMHACGHDGHTAMLLGAARHLAETRAFDGVVHFVFQPAEENEGGALAMIEDGLFRKFRIDRIYGMHNHPGMPIGGFAVQTGLAMASLDLFEITVEGRACHAGRPEEGLDPIPCAARTALEISAIPAQAGRALHPSVVTVTELHAGNAWNVVPGAAALRGTVRCLRPDAQDEIERRMNRLVREVCEDHGCAGRLRYERRYPPLVNSSAEAEVCAEVAGGLVGNGRVARDLEPLMAAEDFSWLLRERPGCYVLLGNGDSAPLHTPTYDFSDEALAWGAGYWTALVARHLSADADRGPHAH